jgi:heat shock protein HtpX
MVVSLFQHSKYKAGRAVLQPFSSPFCIALAIKDIELKTSRMTGLKPALPGLGKAPGGGYPFCDMIAQMSKRIFLFVLVNVLMMVTITAVLAVFHVGRYFPAGGLPGLAVFCLAWGFGGAFVSLALSRLMAKWFMGVRVVPPDTSDPALRQLVETVHGLARHAGLPLPEVGIYESADVNAFATGPTRARALVAVSTGLLERMGQREVEGVLGHEVTHIANGDMVTMTLVQGVVNAFVMFLSRVLAFALSQAMRSRDDDRGGGSWFMQFLFIQLFQVVFGILGSIVVCWFSRWREFRADAGGARLAGRGNMIDALRALRRLHDPEAAQAEAQHSQGFQSLKISGSSHGLLALFATHPPLEERIARLEQGVGA